MRILAILLLVAVAAGAESKLTMQHATGTLEVKITPASTTNPDANVTLARNTLDKTFLGALSGTSKGEMLAALTQTKGSAGYVAIENGNARWAQRQLCAPAQRHHEPWRAKPLDRRRARDRAN